MTDFSNLSTSRIAHVAQSGSTAEATKMNILDRIIDFFKGGVKRDQIEKLFDSIANFRENTGNTSFSEADQLDQFAKVQELRALARPEERHNFQFNIHASSDNVFQATVHIGDVEIYKSDEIHPCVDNVSLKALFFGKFQLNLEDAVTTKNSALMMRTLSEMGDFAITQLPETNAKGEPLYAEERQEFMMKMVTDIVGGLPATAKANLLSAGTSVFGDHVRGILRFSNDALERAQLNGIEIIEGSADALNSEDRAVRALAELRENAVVAKPQDIEARFAEVIQACAEQLGETLLNDFSSENITTYAELSDIEIRALNALNISEQVLRA